MATVYATLDPGNLGTSLTLSNGNLTVTRSGNGAWASALSTISKASGKWYWEVTLNTDSDLMIGGGLSTGFPNQFTGGTVDSWGYYKQSGAIYNNAGIVTNVTAHATNDILGFALDMDNLTLKMYLNNVLKYTATSLNTPYFAILSVDANNDQCTANFGATAFTYTPPAGYNSGLYTVTTDIKTVNGLAKASIKTINGLAIASVKSINGLE